MRHEFNVRRPADKSVFSAIIDKKFFNAIRTELKQFSILTSGLKVFSRFGVLNNKIKSVQNIVTHIKMRLGDFKNNLVSAQKIVLTVARNLTPIFTNENIKIKSSQYFSHLMYRLKIKADNVLVGAQNLVSRIKMRMPMSTSIASNQNLVSRLNIHNTFYSNIKSGQSIVLNIFELLKLWYWGTDDFEDLDDLTLYEMEKDTGLYFANILVNYPVGSTCTCSKDSTVFTAKRNDGVFMFHLPPQSQGTWNVTCTNGSETASQEVEISSKGSLVEVTLRYGAEPSDILDENSWATIAATAAAGEAQNYWHVGDRKKITLNGNVGDGLTFDNYETYVYIIGFNHNGATNTIDFGGFKQISDGKDLALYSYQMNTSSTNLNGWKGSYMRYNVLGSTNVPNGDATPTCTTSPVSGSLMASFPSDLRAVMKPMTIWTDNLGGGSDTASNVTTSVDYLPLLAESEIFGGEVWSNSAEKNHQQQYAYYANGASKCKYQHSSTSSDADWWERSPCWENDREFCYAASFSIADDAIPSEDSATSSSGVAPIFRI